MPPKLKLRAQKNAQSGGRDWRHWRALESLPICKQLSENVFYFSFPMTSCTIICHKLINKFIFTSLFMDNLISILRLVFNHDPRSQLGWYTN